MILITGGTGAIGRRLIDRLARQGKRLRVLTLPGDQQAPQLAQAQVEICYGDIRDKNSLAKALDGVNTVYHLAAVILAPRHPELFQSVNVEGTAQVASAAQAAGVRHLIYVSSASVVYPRTNPYAVSKKKAEEIVRASKLRHTIVRPTLVYYEGGGLEFAHFVNYLKRFPIVPFIGQGRALKSPVHVDDLVQGLANMAGNPSVYNKEYNLSGGDVLSIKNMAVMLLNCMGKRKAIIPIPVFFCKGLALAAQAMAGCTGKEPLLTWQTISGIIQDADLDNRAARQDLGYNPRTFAEGIKGLKL